MRKITLKAPTQNRPSVNIRCRERINSSPPEGLKQSWTEYQVLQGRKVVYRADSRPEAERWISENLSDNNPVKC